VPGVPEDRERVSTDLLATPLALSGKSDQDPRRHHTAEHHLSNACRQQAAAASVDAVFVDRDPVLFVLPSFTVAAPVPTPAKP
jgi:hypothetical protein